MLKFSEREKFKTDTNFTELKTSVAGIQIFVNYTDIKAICFHGKKSKSTWHRRWCKVETMLISIDEQIKAQFDKNKIKVEQKAENIRNTIINRANVQIGDIFYDSWGYDQTQCDFYQVTDRVSAAKIKYRAIGAITVRDSEEFMSARVKPNVDKFIGDEQLGMLQHSGNIAKCGPYGHSATKCNPETSHYISWEC